MHNIALARKALYELSLGNVGLDEVYAKDCKMHQPFFFEDRITPINPSAPSSGEFLAHEETTSTFHDWQYDMDSEEVYATDDPDVIIIRNSGQGYWQRADGKDYVYRNHYVHFFHFKGGLIVEYYEYANPLRLMDAMGIEHPDLPTPEQTAEEYKKLGLL